MIFPHKIPILWYTSSYGKCMGFPIKFPIALEKLAKPIKCVRPGKLVHHTFSIKWVLFSLDSHPMIYTSLLCELYGFSLNGKCLGNWFLGKSYKTHHMWRIWEMGTHTFPMVWVLFSHNIHILWYTL